MTHQACPAPAVPCRSRTLPIALPARAEAVCALALAGGMLFGAIAVSGPASAATFAPMIGSDAGEGSGSTEGLGQHPFDNGIIAVPSMRYQQILDGALFAGADGPLEIAGIAFRVDGDEAAGFSGLQPDIEIVMGHGPDAWRDVTNVFAANYTDTPVSVYAGTPTLGGTAGASPNPYDVSIAFDRGFTYDPSTGPLVFEIIARTTVDMPMLDVEEASQGSPYAGRVGMVSAFGSGAASGALKLDRALMTEFRLADVDADGGDTTAPISAVPLPGSLPLVLAGLGGLVLMRRRG